MTTIRTSCPLCGDVELAPSDVSLRLTPEDGTGVYLFSCPHCEQKKTLLDLLPIPSLSRV